MNARDIEQAGFRWSFIDTLDKIKPRIGEPIIVNTDRHGNQGVHWITIMKVNRNHQTNKRPKFYVYDPLGPRNHRVDSAGVPSMIELKMDMLRYFGNITFHVYPHESQLDTTAYCGWFALYVAQLMKDNPNLSSKDLDTMIRSHFGMSADRGDIRKILSRFR